MTDTTANSYTNGDPIDRADLDARIAAATLGGERTPTRTGRAFDHESADFFAARRKHAPYSFQYLHDLDALEDLTDAEKSRCYDPTADAVVFAIWHDRINTACRILVDTDANSAGAISLALKGDPDVTEVRVFSRHAAGWAMSEHVPGAPAALHVEAFTLTSGQWRDLADRVVELAAVE